ncbi:hypothetical protein [Vulcanisaeta distributa]|uniref:Uncharacterized protein n=1 Tax=Vulcanisaeta distributa (strain DSM 14429 / JCM 11212 / NBRC 100878 / IC-017) TaxID=572478 RepID=E1QSS3_VULDI|nr:hypothetical protein [Vulcanisaeta distributa]ADN49590.1 hypothetical protein Vdis_0177 [Vulcanisaeta distributa DSM 14429]
MSISLSIKEYTNKLNSNYQQIKNSLKELNNILESLMELISLAKKLRLKVPPFPSIEKIELDQNKLSNVINGLRNYSNNVILVIMNQLLPGLSNDINDCEIITDMLNGTKNILKDFIDSVQDLWKYRNELKYLRQCIKGYCDLVTRVIHDGELKEEVKVLSEIFSIKDKLNGISLPITKGLNQCIDNVINNVIKDCNLPSFNDIEKSLKNMLDLLTYFDNMISVVNGLRTLQYNEYSQQKGDYCPEIAKIFDDFMSTIKGLNLNELTLKCGTPEELIGLVKEIEDKRDQYVKNIRDSQAQVMNYLNRFKKVLSNSELREEFENTHNSLEKITNQLITEISGKSVEGENIRQILDELQNKLNSILQFICEKLIPGLGLKDEEFKVIVELIRKGGIADFKDLSDVGRDIIIELCEKGILRCQVSLG